MSNLGILLLFGNFLLNGLIIFFNVLIQLLGDNIDQLSKGGFDLIMLKVIFKVGKVWFSPFYHNYQYYLAVTKCCQNVLHYVAYPVCNQSCPKI